MTKYILLFLYICFQPTIWSQTLAPNAIERQQNQIQQRQAEQINQIQNNADSLAKRKPSPSLRPKLDPLEAAFKDSPSIFIHKLQVTGNTKLSERFVTSLHKNYENKKITVEGTRNILREITNEYIKLGHITCRAYLPPQNLLSGVLEIKIIEGVLEGYSKQKNTNSTNTNNAFPSTIGHVVNLRDIEQGFEQINRLKSNEATMDIRPGNKQGSSNIFIKNKKSKRWHLHSDINNYGLENTGEWQLFNTLSYDNLFGYNDLISYTHGFDPTLASDGGYNEINSIVISVPYGYWLFKGGFNLSTYRIEQTNDLIDIASTGRTKGFNLDADWLFKRNQTTKLSLHTGFRYKNAKNFINDNKLDISSRQTSSASIGVSALKIANKGRTQLYTRLDYTRGLPVLGTRNGRFLGGPTTEFNKFNLSGSLTHYFQAGKSQFTSQTSGNFQYSQDDLFSSEQINLGGQSSIRGYRNESITTDSGFFLKQELNTSLKAKKLFSYEIDTIQPYLAYDVGFAIGRKPDELEGIIDGATAGVRFFHKSLRVDLSASLPLSAPNFIAEDDPIFGISVSSNF